MEVRRLPRNYAGGFERIPNRAIRDTDLSLPALGLLTRLLGDGDRYETIDEMADAYAKRDAETGKAVRGFGRDAYRQAGLELQKAGYLERTNVSAGYRKIETRTIVKAENGTKGTTSTTPQTVADLTSGNDQNATSNRLPLKPSATSPAETGPLGTSNRLSSQPSPISPAETSVCPGEIADGLSPSLPIQTYFQTPDPLQASPGQAEGSTGGPTAEAEGEATPNQKPGADRQAEAAVLVAGLPATHQPGRDDYPKLIDLIAQLLAFDWPAARIRERLEPELPASPRSIFAIHRHRLPLAAPFAARASPVAAVAPTTPWCRECSDARDRVDPESDKPQTCRRCGTRPLKDAP